MVIPLPQRAITNARHSTIKVNIESVIIFFIFSGVFIIKCYVCVMVMNAWLMSYVLTCGKIIFI